jgi:large subunit ribosomal protein L4
MKISYKNIDFVKQGEIELPSCFLHEKINHFCIYDAIKNEMSNKRQGNASSKTISDVAGSTKKPFKQKGTGRARAGSRQSPLWRGGGVTFGPHKRDYSYKIPVKVKREALYSLFSLLLQEKRISVFSDMILQEYKTKKIHNFFSKSGNYKKIVWIISSEEKFKQYLKKSAQNIPYLKLFNIESLELKDIFYSDHVFFSLSAINFLSEKISKKNNKK